jgi:hypothetical protein
MSEKASVPTPVEAIPSVNGGVSAIASAHAPFLYFEGAPTFGHLNGIIRVTLEATRDLPTGQHPSATVGTDRVLVAHLRGNIQAFLALRAAIDGALLLANPAPTRTQN